MSRGELTRQTILEHAARLASQVGLGGLTIGRLAEDLGLSKSGLFAHFQSKEALQVQVLEWASGLFVDEVVRPALKRPRGVPRLRALFEGWVSWAGSKSLPGGCLFVAATAELDDRPGPARVKLVQLQKDWLGILAEAARIAVAEGHFRRGVDPEQVAHDLYGINLAYHHASRLLNDPKAEHRLREGFEALLRAAAAKRSVA